MSLALIVFIFFNDLVARMNFLHKSLVNAYRPIISIQLGVSKGIRATEIHIRAFQKKNLKLSQNVPRYSPKNWLKIRANTDAV